ncbi:MAG: leucyl aminopeptidase [Acidimicrobiales bacterium]
MIRFDTAKRAPRGADLEVVLTSMSDEPDLALTGFEAKPGQTAPLPGRLFVGLGPADRVDAAVVRQAMGAAARAASRAEHVSVVVPDGHAQAVVEGVLLGGYTFSTYRSDPKPPKLRRVTLLGAIPKGVIDRGVAAASAQNLARDLVNEPGGFLTAPVLAERVADAAQAAGAKVTVHDEKSIRRLGLGGVIAVSRGSTQPPRFVELAWDPPRAGRSTPTVALVGKGVTFDAGGLSIKTSDGMAIMKSDMAGAAVVGAVFTALAAVGARVRVRGYLPLTDNMLGGDATRVGDVVRHYGGSTTEVLNTDAEGRLLLADALAFAAERGRPDAAVDVATLTGACRVALGTKIAGLFGRGDGWLGQLEAAAARAGEPVWRMPMPPDERKQLDSKIADRKNVGSKFGGAIAAALFLADFVPDDLPWAHLDIAGPAFNEGGDEGDWPSGATGFGVRTLLEMLAAYERLG